MFASFTELDIDKGGSMYYIHALESWQLQRTNSPRAKGARQAVKGSMFIAVVSVLSVGKTTQQAREARRFGVMCVCKVIK